VSPSVRSAAAAAAFGLMLSAASAQQVLSFDDIGPGGLVPADYGGLDWSAGTWSYFGFAQPPYTPHSGAFRAYVAFESPDDASTIRFPTPAVFDGAWFSGYDVATVSFQLFRDGSLVATSAPLVPTEAPTFLSSGYTGAVDTVIVSAGGQTYYTMDDFSFRSVPAIPEPGTYLLMLVGFAVIGLFLARRRNDD
jgi:hypothetical protein